MNEESISLTRLEKWALGLSCCALIVFTMGLLTGSVESHRPGEELQDIIAFALCLIVSPLLAFSGWMVGFVAILQHPSGPAWSAVTVMILILLFLLLFSYCAWRGTAAFHPNPLII
jgi:magnesium-transporting ATPase (P-type)